MGIRDAVVNQSRSLLTWRKGAGVFAQVVGLLIALGFFLVGNTCGKWGGAIYMVILLPVLVASIAATVRISDRIEDPAVVEVLAVRWSCLVSLPLGFAWGAAYIAFVPGGPFLMLRLPACNPDLQGLLVLEGFLAVSLIGLLTTTPALFRALTGRTRRPGLEMSSRGIGVNGVFRSQQLEWSRVRTVSIEQPAGRSLYGGFKIKGAPHLKITHRDSELPVLMPVWPFRLRPEELVSAVASARKRWAGRGRK